MRRSWTVHHSAMSALISLPPKEFFCFACDCCCGGGGTLTLAEVADGKSGDTADNGAAAAVAGGPDRGDVVGAGADAGTEALP